MNGGECHEVGLGGVDLLARSLMALWDRSVTTNLCSVSDVLSVRPLVAPVVFLLRTLK